MIKIFSEKLFITGTDTGIGKTVVSAMLTKGLGATYWKPVQSGLKEETDTEAVKRLTGLPSSHFKEETYRLTEPLSPHASAAIDGIEIEMDAFEIPDFNTKHLIIEGAGGVLVPLNDKNLIIDLMAQLDIPALVVARSGLGTLNHTLLTIEALRSRDISILGVIMNGPKNESNKKAIEKYGNVKVLAELENIERLDSNSLSSTFNKFFNS
jgi:dethiobiotin synthetase